MTSKSIEIEEKFNWLKTLPDRLVHYHTPGCSIAAIDNFEIEWSRGFGVCEAGTTHAVTPDTLFQAASISKPIFALAVMRLVQAGNLSLDEDVNTYLTSWHISPTGDLNQCITLRHLLSHTAGLTVHGFEGYPPTAGLPTTIQILNGEPPANNDRVERDLLPGLNYRYSGGGITIAQQILVDLLGKSFPEIMRELVLEPIGMQNSTYQQPISIDLLPNTATAHLEGGIPLVGKHHIYPEMAAAGLWTTATDLAKVGVELLQILHGKSSGIWSQETIAAIFHPQSIKQTPEVTTGTFGLGWMVSGDGDGFQFFHSGWNEGFVSMMRVSARGKGIVVMLNSNEGYPLLEEIGRSIATEDE